MDFNILLSYVRVFLSFIMWYVEKVSVLYEVSSGSCRFSILDRMCLQDYSQLSGLRQGQFAVRCYRFQSNVRFAILFEYISLSPSALPHHSYVLAASV